MIKLSALLKESLDEKFPICELKAVSLDQFLDQELNEAEGDFGLGSNVTELPSDEFQSYLDRQAGQPVVSKKTGEPKLDKKGNPVYTTTPLPTDKFKYPYVHPSHTANTNCK